jgi:hypothetical protein
VTPDLALPPNGRPAASRYRVLLTVDGYCGWVAAPGDEPERSCELADVVRVLGPEYENAALTMTRDACQTLLGHAWECEREAPAVADRLRDAARNLAAQVDLVLRRTQQRPLAA